MHMRAAGTALAAALAAAAVLTGVLLQTRQQSGTGEHNAPKPNGTRGSADHGVVLATIVKDEAEYLDEWLSFVQCAGVDHVHLLDDGSTDGTRDVLAPYVDAGLVTVYAARDLPPARQKSCQRYDHDNNNRVYLWKHHVEPETYEHRPSAHFVFPSGTKPGALADGSLFTGNFGVEYGCPQSRQNRFYQHIVDSLVDTTVRWVGLLDVDEFAYPARQGDSLARALAEFEVDGIAAVAVKWQLFGSSFHREKPATPVVESYSMRSPNLDDRWDFVKSFVRPRRGLVANVHVPMINTENSDDAVLVIGETNPVLRVNHYRSKSEEDWAEKNAKGCPHSLAVEFCDHNRPNWRWLYDRNDIGGGVPLALRKCMRARMGATLSGSSRDAGKFSDASALPGDGASRSAWSGEWPSSLRSQHPIGANAHEEMQLMKAARGLRDRILPRVVTDDCKARVKRAAAQLENGLLLDLPRHPYAAMYCPVEDMGNDEDGHVNTDWDLHAKRRQRHKRCDTPDKQGTKCSPEAARILFALHVGPTDDLRVVMALVRRIYDPAHYYVVAIDAKPITPQGEEIKRRAQEFFDEKARNTGVALGMVINSVDVVYGGFSLMEAYMDAWRAGLRLESRARGFQHESWDFVINLSPADWPIHETGFISRLLAQEGIANYVESFTQVRDYIGGRALGDMFVECPGEPCALKAASPRQVEDPPLSQARDREARAGMEDAACEGYSYWLEDEEFRELKPLLKNSVLFGGSAFYVLHRDFVSYTLSCLDNATFAASEPYCTSVQGYRTYLQLGMSGEEIFPQTVLLNGPHCDQFRGANRRWVHWGGRVVARRRQGDYPISSPGVLDPALTSRHVVGARHAFFARKLDGTPASDAARALLDAGALR